MENQYSTYGKGIFKIQSSRGRWQKEVTRMTSNDRLLVDQRLKNNQGKIDFVTTALLAFFQTKKLTVQLLKPLAKSIINQSKEIYLDRLAKRNRHALLCWFCENWSHVLPFIRSSMQNLDCEEMEVPSSPEPHEPRAEDMCDVMFLLNHH